MTSARRKLLRKMLSVYVSVLKDEIEVSDEGRFELPSRYYSTVELKKIAREINRAIRNSSFCDCLEDNDEICTFSEQ